MESASATRLLSVVVPCYNEEECLEATHARLTGVLTGLPDLEYEIVYVDDGSRDRTRAILDQLRDRDCRVRTVVLSRNFGHQVAVSAGLERSRGDAIVLIDADLQDPPEVISQFVARWREGFDVVYGRRAERRGESRFKRLTAGVFYRMLRHLTDTAIPLDSGDFRLMSRRVTDALISMPEQQRFIRGMVSWIGFPQTEVRYLREARFAGHSKYPLTRMIRFALDGITSFSSAPLRMAVWMGLGAAGVAVAGIIYALFYRLFTQDWVSGWAGMFIAILFVGGVQLVFLGVVGEYVGRIYVEVKRRPLYFVDEPAERRPGEPRDDL